MLSIVAASLRRSILQYGRLVFHQLHGRSSVYVLLVTYANGYQFRYEAQRCGLEALHRVVVGRHPASDDGVSRNLHIIAMVQVVGR